MAQATLYVTLSVQQDQQLFELKDAVDVPRQTRARAEVAAELSWLEN
ncbi:MAG: hypothetical protein AAF298_25165 [Cyanobacteria bacterium P01_A01_bin.40]